jgi:hypothetical protein
VDDEVKQKTGVACTSWLRALQKKILGRGPQDTGGWWYRDTVAESGPRGRGSIAGCLLT